MILAGSLTLAAGSGYLASTAIGGATHHTVTTVTINVGTGQTGPQGPAGPAGPPGPTGPPGGQTCPAGYQLGALVINHPGGQVTLWTCLG